MTKTRTFEGPPSRQFSDARLQPKPEIFPGSEIPVQRRTPPAHETCNGKPLIFEPTLLRSPKTLGTRNDPQWQPSPTPVLGAKQQQSPGRGLRVHRHQRKRNLWRCGRGGRMGIVGAKHSLLARELRRSLNWSSHCFQLKQL